jgi:hypothetical protein
MRHLNCEVLGNKVEYVAREQSYHQKEQRRQKQVKG